MKREKIVANVETLPRTRTICKHTTPSWPSVCVAIGVIRATYKMKMYSSLVFLSPGNPWWVVENHARSVLPGIMRPVRRTEMSWGRYARSTKEARVRPAGILEMFAMIPRRSWKHELEWQEKPETWHTRTWRGAEQGIRTKVPGHSCWRHPSVGFPVFTFIYSCLFSKQFPKNQWKKHIIQSYLSQSW